MVECRTWEEEKNVKCIFHTLVEIPGVEVCRIHPLQQEAVKNVFDALKGEERIKVVVLFGSSVNLRCTIHSDLDFVVQLKPDFINNEVKNDISEKIQEACNWNADVLWYDRIYTNKKLMDNVLRGVQIV